MHVLIHTYSKHYQTICLLFLFETIAKTIDIQMRRRVGAPLRGARENITPFLSY